MDKLTHEVRTRNWCSIIQACNTSGISKRQWCEENGIPLRKFYYWQKRIRTDMYVGTVKKETELVPAVLSERCTPVPSFAEIPTTPIANQRASFQPDAVITVGELSIQIANTATGELLDRIGRSILHHAV